VNRPYENEAREMVKPHGFVLDFVGIFDKLEKALAFDSDEVDAIVKDLKLLKVLFQNKMESKVPCYLGLIERQFDDKDVDTLIEHFRDPERRKEFFKEYKEIEMLYEIISPDAFLRPFIEDYTTLSAIYDVVRKAYTRRVMVDRDFQAKTNALVQESVGSGPLYAPDDIVPINGETLDIMKRRKSGDSVKVINLIKSIERVAEDSSDDPFLVAMADRARAVQEQFEQRQTGTAEALEELLGEVRRNEARKKEQAERGFDGLTHFVFERLQAFGVADAETVSRNIKEAFIDDPNWQHSEKSLRELRKKVTFAIFAQCEDLAEVPRLVEELFRVLERSGR
jgi:type I restriction enzyme R subunit